MTFTKTITGSLLAVALALPAMAAETPYKGDGHIMITPDELEWGPVGSMAGNAKIAVIEGDLSKNIPSLSGSSCQPTTLWTLTFTLPMSG
ncbi:hypothetical protein FE848_05395 [Marinobacter sp. 1-3A]|uniref:hypothetical protein n=1 Tax=Marinobacter sp. 1-3A TaxID=2582920 RepID=UPI00190492D0|nr:hypothetical protein [Marinobacter sp. 1-3A]MBK1872652.1 hypothetical protein [Marinobacter sp. 1-3A]